MHRSLVIVAAALVLAACGQKDNVTTHTQPAAPGASPPPKPLVGQPQTSPSGGTAVYPGNAPVTPGGAPAPGEGSTPANAASAPAATGSQSQK
ncbi:MAG TPA: lipoprotein [Burkholderiales bacterium]|nr:lipoprotein [Burkholderiales bacterium]